MVIQIDIDGTIDAAPEFFRWLTVALTRDDHTVLIVSSRTTSKENLLATAAELKEYGVIYDKLILSPEHDNLDVSRFPPSLQAAHRLYVSKLIAAEDHGTTVLYDDCGITSELFRKHLPNVAVFRPLR
ncbi:MAG: hypothetical protein HYX59_14200 [Elusimicrobia bacterium]|nr:hypothetical protein [Elusimicrobiota bacterium]